MSARLPPHVTEPEGPERFPRGKDPTPMKTYLPSLLLLSIVSSSAVASGGDMPPAHPLTICVVSEDPLGDAAVTVEHGSRSLRLCSDACAATFDENPSAYVETLERALIADQEAIYPLDTCVVTGQPLGAGAFSMLHGDRLVKLCCGGCVSGFGEDPAHHLATLDAAAIEAQRDTYPLAHCVVAGTELGGMGAPHETIVAGHLVRLCCAGCLPAVESDPAAVLRAVTVASEGE